MSSYRVGGLVYSDELYHFRTKGSKNGVRRYQYPDGSLTPEGREHYGVGPPREEGQKEEKPKKEPTRPKEMQKMSSKEVRAMSDEDLRKWVERARLENQYYNELANRPKGPFRKAAEQFLNVFMTQTLPRMIENASKQQNQGGQNQGGQNQNQNQNQNRNQQNQNQNQNRNQQNQNNQSENTTQTDQLSARQRRRLEREQRSERRRQENEARREVEVAGRQREQERQEAVRVQEREQAEQRLREARPDRGAEEERARNTQEANRDRAVAWAAHMSNIRNWQSEREAREARLSGQRYITLNNDHVVPVYDNNNVPVWLRDSNLDRRETFRRR